MTEDRTRWCAEQHGGPITHVALDYGHTLTASGDVIDLMLGMRPVSTAAIATIRKLDDAGVTLALVSNTGPSQDRRRALQAAGVAGLFEDRVYLSHEIGLNKSSTHFFQYVLDDLEVEPHGLLVCGNNIDTDVRTPTELGIPAVLLGPLADRAYLPPRAALITHIGDLPHLLTTGRPITHA